jgi:hypothetical protein
MIKQFFFDAELDTLKLPTLISSRMTMPLSVYVMKILLSSIFFWNVMIFHRPVIDSVNSLKELFNTIPSKTSLII